MPRYFFHTSDGAKDVDDIGLELPDEKAARHEAIRFGGGLLQDEPHLLDEDRELRIKVVDEAGNMRFAVVMLAIDAD